VMAGKLKNSVLHRICVGKIGTYWALGSFCNLGSKAKMMRYINQKNGNFF